MDQPLRTSDYCQQQPQQHQQPQQDVSKSPPTLLDLGSGTIHRTCLKSEPSDGFWMLPTVDNNLSTALDDSNSSSSRLPQCSPEIIDNNIRNTFRAEDSCRMNFPPEVLQRMNINLVQFHLDECKDSQYNTKYQMEDPQTRLYNLPPLEDNTTTRYHHQTINTGLDANIGCNITPQLQHTNISQCIEPQYIDYNQLEYQRQNEIKHDNQFLISDSSQDESTTSLGEFNLRPQTSSVPTENNFFQSFQYQNQNYFQHIPHH